MKKAPVKVLIFFCIFTHSKSGPFPARIPGQLPVDGQQWLHGLHGTYIRPCPAFHARWPKRLGKLFGGWF